MHDTFNIWGIEIAGYGLMIGLGVIGLVLTMLRKFKVYKVPDNNIDIIIIITALSGFMMWAAAAFFNDLWHYLGSPENGWKWGTGITFSGGLIGGLVTYIIAYWLIMRKERYNIFFYLNIIIVGVVFTHAMGRIGCFLGGCCYGGVPKTAFGRFFAVTFPSGSITAMEIANRYGTNVAVLPTMLFESAGLFVLFIVLYFFVKKHQSSIYLITYSIFRFLLEFLRDDNRGASPISFLSPSQFLSIFMLIAGVLLLIFEDKITAWIARKYNPAIEMANPAGVIFANGKYRPEVIEQEVVTNDSETKEVDEVDELFDKPLDSQNDNQD